MKFIPSVAFPESVKAGALWFLFDGSRLLVRLDDRDVSVPKQTDLKASAFKPERSLYLGTLDGTDCFAAALPTAMPCLQGWQSMNLRELIVLMSPGMLKTALVAVQVVAWDRNFRFCGRCGHPTQDHPLERMKVCSECGLTQYPRLTPAVMVAVIRDEREILLANGDRFPPGFFSVLAGFVEPGETLEDCVIREVKEEVGLTVGGLRYFGSQPWPFPDSLMVAFTAVWEAGAICVDGREIRQADWFTADCLPRRPDATISIAGRLIDWFQQAQATKG
jgi:NAD+ diphosphatase